DGDQREAGSGVLGLARGGLLAAPGVAAAPPPALAELRSGSPGEAPSRMLSLVLQAVADEQPVVIFVDDAQWLDRASLVALLEAVAAGLDLQKVGGAWPEPLKTFDQTLPGELPDAVVAAIRVLFGKLSGPARQVLAAAAVLGGRVPASVLARTSGVGQEALDAALDELEWARLLSAEPRGYAFVARLVRG